VVRVSEGAFAERTTRVRALEWVNRKRAGRPPVDGFDVLEGIATPRSVSVFESAFAEVAALLLAAALVGALAPGFASL